MKHMLRLLTLTVLALIASGLSLSAQTGTTPVPAPNLVMTVVGSPTITSSAVQPGGTTYQVQATFNASLTAQSGDVTIGLPAASQPLIGNTSTFVTVLKNGASDTSTPYAITVAYTQPSSGVTPGTNSTFVLSRGNTVTVPISVAFVVANGGGNTYAVKLNSYAWTESGGRSSSLLSGTSWTTAAISAGSGTTPGTPTIPSTPVPDYVTALRSTADLSAYLASTARVVDIYVSASSQIGNTVNKRIQLQGPATTRIIDQAVRNAALQIDVSNATSQVFYQVDVHSADYRITLTGYDAQRPENGRGGLVADFKLKMRFQGDVLMLVPNIQQATYKQLDANGNVVDTRSLGLSQQSSTPGFYASPSIVGGGLLEITVNDGTPSGKLTTYDLRSGTTATSTKVATTAMIEKENVVYVLDKTEINLIPETVGGRGKNVLGEIELTRTTTVSIAAMTTEGKKALSFRYRQISPTFTAAWTTAQASNGIISISFAAGDWQVIPDWDPRDCSEPIPDRN